MICLPTAHRGSRSPCPAPLPVQSTPKVPAVIQLWQLLHFPRIYQPVSVRCLPARHVHVLLISCGHTYFNVRDSILFSFLLLYALTLPADSLSVSLCLASSSFCGPLCFRASALPVERFYFVRFNVYYKRFGQSHTRSPAPPGSIRTRGSPFLPPQLLFLIAEYEESPQNEGYRGCL